MVYFAQATEGGSVKIGYSQDVPARLAQLESHYGRRMALLATLPGGREEERAVHDRFAHLRLGRTEQFRPAADLMAFIGRPLLVGANPDAVEAMSGPDDRVMIAQFKGPADFRDWFEELATASGLTGVKLIETSLIEYARNHGFSKQAPIRTGRR